MIALCGIFHVVPPLGFQTNVPTGLESHPFILILIFTTLSWPRASGTLQHVVMNTRRRRNNDVPFTTNETIGRIGLVRPGRRPRKEYKENTMTMQDHHGNTSLPASFMETKTPRHNTRLCFNYCNRGYVLSLMTKLFHYTVRWNITAIYQTVFFFTDV